jgi:hypothetical protein
MPDNTTNVLENGPDVFSDNTTNVLGNSEKALNNMEKNSTTK